MERNTRYSINIHYCNNQITLKYPTHAELNWKIAPAATVYLIFSSRYALIKKLGKCRKLLNADKTNKVCFS